MVVVLPEAGFNLWSVVFFGHLRTWNRTFEMGKDLPQYGHFSLLSPHETHVPPANTPNIEISRIAVNRLLMVAPFTTSKVAQPTS
jgi:hypothetical protein